MTTPIRIQTQSNNTPDDQPIEVNQAVARLASIAPELLPPGAADAVLDRARALVRHRTIRESCAAAVNALAAGLEDPDANPGLLHALGVEAAGAEKVLAVLPDADSVDLPPDLAAVAMTTAAGALQAAAGIQVTQPDYVRDHDLHQLLPHGRRGFVDAPVATPLDLDVAKQFSALLHDAADLSEQARRWSNSDNSTNTIDRLIVATGLLHRAEELRRRAAELEPQTQQANAERRRLGLAWSANPTA